MLNCSPGLSPFITGCLCGISHCQVLLCPCAWRDTDSAGCKKGRVRLPRQSPAGLYSARPHTAPGTHTAATPPQTGLQLLRKPSRNHLWTQPQDIYTSTTWKHFLLLNYSDSDHRVALFSPRSFCVFSFISSTTHWLFGSMLLNSIVLSTFFLTLLLLILFSDFPFKGMYSLNA